MISLELPGKAKSASKDLKNKNDWFLRSSRPDSATDLMSVITSRVGKIELNVSALSTDSIR